MKLCAPLQRTKSSPQLPLCTYISFTLSVSYIHPAHDDVIKWKHFPRYWPFMQGIPRSTANTLHKGQWRVALILSLICAWINSWVNNREAGDFRRYRAHYDVIVMWSLFHLVTEPRVISTTPNFPFNMMAWQWAETLMEIRGTLADIRGTTK